MITIKDKHTTACFTTETPKPKRRVIKHRKPLDYELEKIKHQTMSLGKRLDMLQTSSERNSYLLPHMFNSKNILSPIEIANLSVTPKTRIAVRDNSKLGNFGT